MLPGQKLLATESNFTLLLIGMPSALSRSRETQQWLLNDSFTSSVLKDGTCDHDGPVTRTFVIKRLEDCPS